MMGPARVLSMEAIVIFFGAMAAVLLVKVPRLLAPAHYFEIAEIIHGMNAVTWQGIVVRFSSPVVVTAIAGLSYRESQGFVGAGIGFLSALFLIWPAVIDRRLLPWQGYGREPTLYMLYGMFVASFTMLGLGTGLITGYLEEPLQAASSGDGVTKVGEALRSQVSQVASGLVVLVIGAIAIRIWSRFDKVLNPQRTEPANGY